VVLSTRSNVYYLDIWLPIDIDSDECGAQFDKATHVKKNFFFSLVFISIYIHIF